MRWRRARYQRKKVRVQMKDTPGFEQPDQSQNDDARSPLWTRSRAVKLWDLVSQLSYWTPACEGKRRSPIHGSLQHAFCFRVLTFEGALFSSPHQEIICYFDGLLVLFLCFILENYQRNFIIAERKVIKTGDV